ncbi:MULTISPECIES: hypothetical protein [unclassified Parvimonas]|uniref:hypothetical protein n=1 Tax=unclassified Parvimonas TaxID=1151464 RepID=UPI0005873A63|nr:MULTISPECIES: hypothetical protein [unclassified Parvimonas]MEB3011770.1 hypothetical protein [Parvimonas sp. D2]MEB3087262.1 hypothetical protein [Parvimonas sp. D4]
MRLLSRYLAKAVIRKTNSSRYKNYIYFAIMLIFSLFLTYAIYFNLTVGKLDSTKIIGIVLCSISLVLSVISAIFYFLKIFKK